MTRPLRPDHPADFAALDARDHGAFAQFVRDRGDQLADACDTFATAQAEPRFRDVAILLARAGLLLRELE